MTFMLVYFESNWKTVGQQVVLTIQNFFEIRIMNQEINKTHMYLIPEVKHPKNPSRFRPIGLCNTIYKMIAKIISNRIKPLLHKIIFPFRSTFLSSRQISDNIIVAHEIIRSFKKMKAKSGGLGIKMDMSKAFDKVNQNFFLKALKSVGFTREVCDLIEQCISTTSIGVLLNVILGTFFNPTRGLR